MIILYEIFGLPRGVATGDTVEQSCLVEYVVSTIVWRWKCPGTTFLSSEKISRMMWSMKDVPKIISTAGLLTMLNNAWTH